MKRYLTLLIFIGFPCGLLAQGMGFDQLAQAVRDKNQRVRAARMNLDAARRELGYLGRSYLPTVEAEAGREAFRTGVEDKRTESYGTVGANVNLFRSGRDRLEEKRRRAAVQAAEAEWDQTVREELKEARTAFWLLAFQREMEAVVAEAINTNDALLKAANKKIDSGISTPTDRLEFEINRRALQQDLVRLQTESDRAEKTLVLLTGTTDFQIPSKIPHEHDDRMLSFSFDSSAHPSIRILQTEREQKTLESRDANRWWTPSVDLYSHYSLYTFREREFDDREDRDETVTGGKVSLPLFDGLQSRAMARSNRLRSEAAAQERDHVAKTLELEAETGKKALQRLHDLVHSAEEGVNLGNQYLKNTRNEYVRGVKNSPDLANALEKYVDLKRRDAEIRLEYQLHKAHLLTLLEDQ